MSTPHISAEMGRGDYVKMLGFNYREMEEQGIMTPLLNLNDNLSGEQCPYNPFRHNAPEI